MINRQDIAVQGMLLFFFIAITLSFSGQLPDMDFMPRMITESIFILAFSTAFFFIFRHSNYTFPKLILVNPIVISFEIFVLIVCFSWFKSINPNDALFEILKWIMMGLYLVMLPMLLYVCKDPLRVISRGVLLSHTAILIAGVWQVFSLIEIAQKKHEQFQWDYQVSSLLSTKNSLAEYFVLALPFLIYSLRFDIRIWKVITAINIIGGIFFLLKIKSFAAFVAVIIAILLLSILLFIAYKEKLRLKTGLSKMAFSFSVPFAFALLSLALVFIVNKADGFRKLNIVVTYLSGKTNDIHYNDNSVFERMLLWRNSLSMIKEHLPTGVGIANWKILFPSYGYSGAKYLASDHIKFTRPHNDFLQVFAETGLAGFVAYVSFFGYLIYITIKNYFKTRSVEWFVLLSGIICFFIVSLFGFPMERVLVLLMIIVFASLVIVFHARLGDKKNISFPKASLLILVCFIVFSFYSTKVCLARLKDEAVYSRMIYQKEHLNWKRMYQFSSNLDGEYFPIDYTATPTAWHKGTALYLNNQIKEALTFYKQAEVQAPFHVQVVNDIGAAYLNMGDYDNAKKYLARALSINPDFYEAKLNQTFAVFNTGNKYGAYVMFKDLYKTSRPYTYADHLKIIVYAIADSVIRSRNINLSSSPALAAKFNKAYLWSQEERADSTSKNFIELINKDLDLYK